VRFYREIGPAVGVRVPACFEAADTDDGTLLVLEDLSAWDPGADPVAAAGVLAGLHRGWSGRALARWPWLRRSGAAVDLVEDLYGDVWPRLVARPTVPPRVRALARRLAGKVAESERAAGAACPDTLVHGDASLANMRTSPGGVIALLDWEDASAAPGVTDLAWLLVSSVEPEAWDDVIAAYGTSAGLIETLPAIAVQGLLSMSDAPEGSAEEQAWIGRLNEAASRLT
jgi:Ser/Thr protein kinase RdoA (MazF antagonist)